MLYNNHNNYKGINKMRKIVIAIIFTILTVIMLGFAYHLENQDKDRVTLANAKELSLCYAEVAENKGTCHIEYKYDKSGYITTGEVIYTPAQ